MRLWAFLVALSCSGGDPAAEEACATDRWKDASSASCANSTELFDADVDADDAVVAPLAISTGVLFPSGPGLVFSPPSIDFGVRSVCTPHFSGFNITNNVPGRVVEIFSIAAGSTPQFIVNKFRPATLAEGESLHVKIVFLPRNPNAVTGSLLIKTSVGGFFMAVAGEAEPNQYELVPFTDAELPMGKVYNPPIIVHNPLDVPLQIKEVFTTEKFLHLKLPKGALKEQQAAAAAGGSGSSSGDVAASGGGAASGAKGGGRSARMWTVPPRSSKHIINLSFQSHTPGKYNGYIHVKTDRDHLLIPVAVVVLRRSIYAYPREIDFGSLALGASAHFPISLLNARESGLAIRSVRLRDSDPRLALVVQGHGARPARGGPSAGRTWIVSPRLTFAPFEKVNNALTLTYTHPADANLSLSADLAVRGRIFVVTNQTAPLEIPYTARLLRGSFTVTSAATSLLFNVGTPEDNHPHRATFVDAAATSNLSHTVQLVNKFEVPAKILSITVATSTETASGGEGGCVNTLSAAHLVVSYAMPGAGDEAAMTIASGDAFPAISISLDVPAALEARRGARGVLLRAELVIVTNVTSKRIPILVYDRHLNIAIAADPYVAGNGLSRVTPGAGCVAADNDSDALAADADAGAAECSAEVLHINFGRMATKPEKRIRILNLTNANPSNVTLRRGNLWKPLSLELINVYSSSNVGGGLAEALYGEDDDDADEEHSVALGDMDAEDADEDGSDVVSAAAKAWEMSKTLQLAPGDVASFAVTVHAPGREKTDTSDDAIVFVTNTERIAITSQYATVSGALKLTPSVLVFDPVFPGTVVTKKLFATSTFAEDMKIMRIGVSDDRMSIGIYKNATMKNGARVGIAEVSFNALANCSGSVLSQICDHDSAVDFEAGDNDGPEHVSTEAIESMRKYSSAWRKLRAGRMMTVRTSVVVETAFQRAMDIEVQAVLKRPKVCGVTMKFPLSQVNALTSKHVIVNNPSDFPLAVRLLLPPPGEIPIGLGVDGATRPIFHIRSGAKRSAIVPPHSKAQLGPVLFEPAQKMLYQSSLYIANNLTRLSRIALSGRGGSGRMVLKANGAVVLSNGRFMLREHGLVEVAPNSPDGIEFIANASHLVGPLDDGTLLGPSPNGAVAGWGQTRPLRITNDGDLPMTLNSVHIPGGGCEYGGFKIEPCIARKNGKKGTSKSKRGQGSKKKKAKTVRAYTLAPKESYDVWITYQHDLASCSVARFREVLQFDTSLGMQMYPMTVETRRNVFSACEEAVLKQHFLAYLGLTPRMQRSGANVVVCVVLFVAVFLLGTDLVFFLRHRAVRAVATSADDVVQSVFPSSGVKSKPSACAQIKGGITKLLSRHHQAVAEVRAAAGSGANLSTSPHVQQYPPSSVGRRASNDGASRDTRDAASASATAQGMRAPTTAAAKRAAAPKASMPTSSTASKKSLPSSSSSASSSVAKSAARKPSPFTEEDKQIALYVRLLNEGKEVGSQMVYSTIPKNSRTEMKIAASVLASERERAAKGVTRGVAATEGARSGSATGAPSAGTAAASLSASASSSAAGAKAKASVSETKSKQDSADLQREIALLKEKQLAWEAKQRMEENAKALELDSARVELAKLREQNRLRQVRAEEEAALERRRAQELERKLSKEAKEAELASQEAQIRAELALAKKRRQLEEEYRLLKLETARFKKLEAEKKAKKALKRREKEAKKTAARAERAEAKRRAAATCASSLADSDAVEAEHRDSLLDQLSLIGNVLDDSPPGGRVVGRGPGSSSSSRPGTTRSSSGGSTGAPSWASDPIPISGGAGSGAGGGGRGGSGGVDNGWGLSASADSTGGGGGGFGLLSDVAPSPFAPFGASNVFGSTFGSSPPTGGDAFPGGPTSMGAASGGEHSLAPHWSSTPADGGVFNPLGSLFSDVDGSSMGGALSGGVGAGAGDDAAFDPNEFAFDTSTTAFGEGSFFGAMTFDDDVAIEDSTGSGGGL